MSVGECGEPTCLSSVSLMDVLTLNNCKDNMHSAIHS